MPPPPPSRTSDHAQPAKRKKKPPTKPPEPTATPNPTPPPAGGQPVFGQPAPSPDPAGFVDKSSDSGDYSLVDPTLLQPIPSVRGGAAEPVLTLAQVLGTSGPATVAAVQKSGQIVFHSVGDTGSVKGPSTQSLVADKMVADFTEMNAADVPSFFFHLGDVIYNFGEGRYYYDQFYEPYRDYPAPILAIPGNHDGVVYSGDPAPTLDAFLRNFCSASPVHTAEAAGLLRTAMVQPSVYFTFDAPFVRILGIYSNVLEDPGVISSEGNSSSPVDDRQIAFLTAALSRARKENYTGAVIIAVHHPPYTFGSVHSGSPRMLQDIETAINVAGFWPHAILSGHAHNYQRFTRLAGKVQVPFVVCGDGGHHVNPVQRGGNGGPIRTPMPVNNILTFENYDDKHYGYLRIIVNSQTLRIEYHPAIAGSSDKTPNDVVTVDLKNRTVS